MSDPLSVAYTCPKGHRYVKLFECPSCYLEGEKETPPLSAACRNCRFYVPHNEYIGRCRRHAPAFVAGHEAYNPGAGLPVVYPEGWCGDHQPNPPEPIR